jgi:hypothetical protein
VANSFTVSQRSQTLSFTSPGNQVLGTGTVALSASASSGLAVGFASNTPLVCTVSGSTLTLVTAGTCSVTASQTGNTTYAAATPVSNSFNVAPAAQTISFTSPGAQVLGTAPPVLAASASSSLPVTLASSTGGVCTVNGSTLALVSVGTCTLTANQGGNANYAAAATVTVSFSVSAAPLTAQTISFSSPGNQVLGGGTVTLSATASSGLLVSFSSGTQAVCTVSGSGTLTLLTAGTCTINADQAGNASYQSAPQVSNSFTVSQRSQTISFTSPGSQGLATGTVALSATATSGLSVSFASTTPSVCTVSGSTLTLVLAGTCSVTASQAGNTTYAAAASVSNSFNVSTTSQTITFNSPGNQLLGGGTVALSASATSGLAVSFHSTTTSVCTVSGSTLTLVLAGTCSVTASQAGNAAYGPATPVSNSFTVSQRSQSINFPALATQTMVTGTVALSATATSGLAVSFVSAPVSVCTVSGSTLTLVSAGPCTVTASQGGNTTYAAAPSVSNSFNVSTTSQTITFNSPGNQLLGSGTVALSASATSGLAVTFDSTTTSVCTVSGSTLTLVLAGTCSVTASQVGNAAYAAAAPVSNSFTVSQRSQTITFTSPGNQTVGTTPPALVATSSSGLLVTLASSTTGVCTVSGSTLTLVSAGTCSITASQAGSTIYAPATSVIQSFTVAPLELFGNVGFELAGATTPADKWLAANAGYTRSTDAHSGSFSAQLSSPAFRAAVMLQNSVEQGGRPALTVGTTPVLTFWAKGTAGGTGNVLFALRYLDGVGNIKANSLEQHFEGLINPNTWTRITYTLPGGVPVGAVAAFIEFSQAIGPIDASNPAGLVLIDDLSLVVPATSAPASTARKAGVLIKR